MPDTAANIFLTKENLAFSMPLILICTTYAYFTYVPIRFSVPLVIVVALVLLLRTQLHAQRGKKILGVDQLDEKAIREIVGQDDELLAAEKDAEAKKKTLKAKNKVEQRLAQEKKAETKLQNAKKAKKSKKGADQEDDDFDDEDALLKTFAKGSRDKEKKK